MSEFELIARLRSRARHGGRVVTGIGDDAAVTFPGGATATSVDAMVEGKHFRREWSDPASIAHKAVASTVSDLAAMAAEPGELYVTLGLPPDTEPDFTEALANGFELAAERFGLILAGGDTVASPVLFLSLAAVGHAGRPEDFRLRSGARPGEVVAVTGQLGGAAAGLWLLRNGDAPPSGLPDQTRRDLVERQLRPLPRLEAGRLLAASGAGAMVDLSDGLAADLGHIAELSGVAVTIDASALPVQAGVDRVAAAAGLDRLDLAIGGGEDYELALTIDPAGFDRARRELGAIGLELTRVGSVEAGSGVRLTDRGEQRPLPGGFDHFR